MREKLHSKVYRLQYIGRAVQITLVHVNGFSRSHENERDNVVVGGS